MLSPTLTADSLALKLLSKSVKIAFRSIKQILRMTPGAPVVQVLDISTNILSGRFPVDPRKLLGTSSLSDGYRILDLNKLSLTSTDRLLFSMLVDKGHFAPSSLPNHFRDFGFKISPPRTQELARQLEIRAGVLAELGLIRAHVGREGRSYFTLGQPTTSPDPLALYHVLSREESVVRDIARKYGAFNPTTFQIHSTYHRIQAPAKGEFQRLKQAAQEMKGLMEPTEQGFSLCPHALDDLVEVSATPHGHVQAMKGSRHAIDRRIADIVNRYGVFNRQTFQRYLQDQVIAKKVDAATPTTFGEKIRQARNTDLVTYLKASSVELEAAGNGWHKIKGSGGIAVKGNAFCHLSDPNFLPGRKKNAIEFVMEFEKAEFKEAVQRLNKFAPQVGGQQVKQALQSPPIQHGDLYLVDQVNLVEEYLTQHRGLDRATLQPHIGNSIRQDRRGNVVFLSHDEQGRVRNASKRNTHASPTFKGAAKGSDRRFGFHLPGSPTHLVVTESPIDALSLKEIDGVGHSYLSLNGLSPAPLQNYLSMHLDTQTITFALDNDRGQKPGVRKGIETAVRLAKEWEAKGYTCHVRLPEHGKDWNEQLRIKKGLAEPSDLRAHTHRAYFEGLFEEPYQAELTIPEGWTPERLNKSYLRHVNRLVTANDPGLKVTSPSIERHRASTLKNLSVPQSLGLEAPGVRPLDHAPINLGRSQKLADLRNLTFSHAELEFMNDLGRFGVADKSGWIHALDRAFLESNFYDLKQSGELADHASHLLNRNLARDRSLGKLIRAGLIEHHSQLMGREGASYQKRYYTLTRKGRDLLKRTHGTTASACGPYKKKTSELFHDLKTFKLYQLERQRLFLEGKPVTSIASEAQLKAQSASELESLRRQMMNISGFSKNEQIERTRLQSKSFLTHEESSRLKDLNHHFQTSAYTPGCHNQFLHLDTLVTRGVRLDPSLKSEHQRLTRLRELIEAKAPGVLKRYDKLSAQALPDFRLDFLEVTLNDNGDIISQPQTNFYEMDSGGGLCAQRGGYTRQEILHKLQHMEGTVVWATPGGLGSAQGQKVAQLMRQTQSHGYVVSI